MVDGALCHSAADIDDIVTNTTRQLMGVYVPLKSHKEGKISSRHGMGRHDVIGHHVPIRDADSSDMASSCMARNLLRSKGTDLHQST